MTKKVEMLSVKLPTSTIFSLIKDWETAAQRKTLAALSYTKFRSTATTPITPPKRYYLGSKYPGVYLSGQEARCMYYFIHGFTQVETGQAMEISHRTISSYTHNMKLKMSCRNKQELVQLVLQTDFVSKLEEFS
ncbi:MAG: LuxR C-terminal-related transcriptional regulator [Gammaproteobacteria bacterium]